MAKITNKELITKIESIGNFQLNELTKEIELNNNPINIELYYLILADKYNIDIEKGKAADIISFISETNSYNPIQLYFKKLILEEKTGKLNQLDLTEIASNLFRLDDPIYSIYFKKWMIGAISRAFRPGCKNDTCLILQGDQGIGKSTMFKILGGDFFDDSMGDLTNLKDDCLTLHRSWIQEWGELDRIFNKSQVSSVKHFLSKSEDMIRPPYGRTYKKFLRMSVIVGTTNKQEFLKDETGSRRFWIIPVNFIDLDWLTENRDRLWLTAYHYYRNGDIYWLTGKEEKTRDQNNNIYQESDLWKVLIFDYCDLKDHISIYEIVDKCLELPYDRITRADQMRIASILTAIGFVKRGKMGTYNFKKTRIWERDLNKFNN